MDTTLSISLSHQVAIRRQMDVIANNIANMSTTAFKRESVVFAEYVVKSKGDGPNSTRRISYVQDYGVKRNMTDGNYEATGNVLDIALSGNGMFQVKKSNGDMAYTRNGHLAFSDESVLITSNGQEIMDDGGKSIKIPPNVSDIKIASDGTISTPEIGIIAKLKVVTVADTSTLKKIGGNMFTTNSQIEDATDFKIIQGVTESSNVTPIIEISRMIDVSRSYIETAKMMDRLQESQSRAINQLAKVG